MIDKLGRRIAISIIVCWMLLGFNEIQGLEYLYYLFIAVMSALCIECGYDLLSEYHQHIKIVIIGFIVLLGIGFYFLRAALLMRWIGYIVLSISVDLYRKYSINKLLKDKLELNE